MSKKNGRMIAAGIVLLALLGGVVIQPVVAKLGGGAPGGQGSVDPFSDIIQGLEAQLKGKHLAQEQEAMEKKLQSVGMAATQRAEGLALEQAGKAPQKTLTPLPVPPVHRLPDGIDENPVIPPYAKGLILTNAWRKTTPERNYLIYAGALQDDPVQGIVYVQNQENFGFYVRESPLKSGSLKIVKEENLRLTLQAANGETLYFDAQKEVFVDANGSPLTATKSAPAYPVP